MMKIDSEIETSLPTEIKVIRSFVAHEEKQKEKHSQNSVFW